jgi:hypothetical protein
MVNKKGIELALNTVVVAVLVIVVLAVVVGVFTGLFGKEAEIIGGQISGLDPCEASSDFDRDGILNSADACVCIKSGDKNDCAYKYESCPPGTTCE